MKLMISDEIMLMASRQQINPEQNSVQSVVWPQLQHEMVKGLVTKLAVSNGHTSTVDCRSRKTRREQCSQLVNFLLFQSSHAVFKQRMRDGGA